ncbi:chloramphenicol-sensitive protein RarD [Nocardiopsis flavescens]|uniref:Chloramphenicol-sensitive protein RarD n=1 Tax=Nocardiopsis flavescens TaxID=758803 RepID=A0A1M6TPP1_9ACTN|nr:EamA family transporter RarD [Nocardiopsis flavescens]SHK58883.1 chloramphenicol-sensitive protein RarD [Nocardiopsis flavescens]
MPESNRGVALGAGAFLLWGFAALYWPFLSAAAPAEILAHRMVWSLLAMAVVLVLARRGWKWLPGVIRSPRRLLPVAAAAVLIAVNWWGFIYAVSTVQTLQASLAYFINPLMSVCLGVLVFSERLRAAQWVAVGLGGLAVVVMTVGYGVTPWLALVMASSFAAYGAVKKYVDLDGVQSLTVETLVMFLPALGYVLYLESSGAGTALSVSPAHTALLVGGGFVTALPLLMFGVATRRVPLSVIGMLQYIAPTLMFLIGWLVQGEEMPLARWAGFALVWLALCVFVFDQLHGARARSVLRRREREAERTREREDGPAGEDGPGRGSAPEPDPSQGRPTDRPAAEPCD